MIDGQSCAITPDQLCVGLYVTLDVGWMEHPFMFRNFKIRNQSQLVAIKALRLGKINYIPSKSDAQPLAPESAEPGAAPTEVTRAMEELWNEKHEHMAQHRTLQDAAMRSEKNYLRTTESAKFIMRELAANPEDALRRAEESVGDLVQSFLTDENLVLRLVGDEVASDNAQRHNVNVVVLSLLLARAAGLNEDMMKILGLGALFHDIGLGRTPSKFGAVTAPLSVEEQQAYELHPVHGVELAAKVLDLPPEVVDIIHHHHECIDGSGFPDRQSGDAIPPLTRIVAIADAYDLCCNPNILAHALAPAEAMAHMYKHERHRFDDELLQQFIRCMGIYPPGTLVVLSTGAMGIVVSVNSDSLLQPSVLLYDSQVPRAAAVVFDMREDAEVKVVRAVRPNALPPEAVQYLNPPRRVSFFVDAAGRCVG
ncbi:MAG: HD-GYP domain-containing protein [Burkholderiales bacterium]